MGLPEGEEITTLAFLVLIQYRRVTDRRTDGRAIGYSALSIMLSRAKIIGTVDIRERKKPKHFRGYIIFPVETSKRDTITVHAPQPPSAHPSFVPLRDTEHQQMTPWQNKNGCGIQVDVVLSRPRCHRTKWFEVFFVWCYYRRINMMMMMMMMMIANIEGQRTRAGRLWNSSR